MKTSSLTILLNNIPVDIAALLIGFNKIADFRLYIPDKNPETTEQEGNGG